MASDEKSRVCINEVLTDDELRAILSKLETDKDRDGFGLVCKRWLAVQSTERKKLCARAGPLMLQKMADRFVRLVELDLSQSASRSFFPGVTDSDLSVIAHGFRCLRILDLRCCKGVTDAGMMAIGSSLSSLQSLNVSDCRKLTDKGLGKIASGCGDLRSLHLSGCRLITDLSLQALSDNCKYLEELGLQGCNNITDSGLTILVDGCRRIKFLDVSKCSNVSDVGVSNVCNACSSSLRTLKMLGCRIGDPSIVSLAQSCKNLETLVISGCPNVSNDSIKSLVITCKDSLKNLRMDSCLNLSDASLIYILSHCRNLEALDIGCCEDVSDAAFEVLGNVGFESRLKVLKIYNCPKITVFGVGKLLDCCMSLKYLDVRSCPHITKKSCHLAGLQFPECCKVNFTGSLSDLDATLDVFI
ncbi:hypothetical protein Scep_015921 [Stephania cephalantha]|uniref:F-box/LRR-repeat protein 15-like leucin rich repeat domain-containing protein n=1 Tax=Stephania cephalantha TaxID=152367 RepID=A0AAP0IMU5_9MAGN